MYDFLLALHVLFAVFAVGPLVHAATTAGRGVRKGDGVATAASARLLRVYGYASVLVILSGLILMNLDSPYGPGKVGEFGQTWIWLSFLLWLVAAGVILGVVVPTLDRATALIGEEKSVVALTGRVAAAGGIVGLLFAVVVFLMVYRPGR
ncbi:hypothetical protein SAMN05443575_3814 [Jatrophihabitans endophyticus]|uniref:Integral membrane protein (DUF2269) n=1 Tax=Jatrophihabitans endophyticus TaxID=1206085 RepID=A0A1M5STH0_9ACTN|nr:hypothetical protein [Jatrophihabitans endophyticus]SHH41802.1 hypothetical protein SAMN05443575_3814 [Jatrophihabitans endophyticus]